MKDFYTSLKPCLTDAKLQARSICIQKKEAKFCHLSKILSQMQLGLEHFSVEDR